MEKEYCDIDIRQEGDDYVLQFSMNGRNVSDFLVSGACMAEIAKKVANDPITKFMLKNPPTEEGLNKARYRLGYEDGYRECIKNASEWLEERIYDIVLSSKPMSQASKEFIDNFKETMEEKL